MDVRQLALRIAVWLSAISAVEEIETARALEADQVRSDGFNSKNAPLHRRSDFGENGPCHSKLAAYPVHGIEHESIKRPDTLLRRCIRPAARLFKLRAGEPQTS